MTEGGRRPQPQNGDQQRGLSGGGKNVERLDGRAAGSNLRRRQLRRNVQVLAFAFAFAFVHRVYAPGYK
jgi:hypothetical protein